MSERIPQDNIGPCSNCAVPWFDCISTLRAGVCCATCSHPPMSARPPFVALVLDESERQMVLMALASLSIERPGWEDALNRLAKRLDAVHHGRALMYDEFRRLRQ